MFTCAQTSSQSIVTGRRVCSPESCERGVLFPSLFFPHSEANSGPCSISVSSSTQFNQHVSESPAPHSCAGPLVWPVGRHGLGSPMLRGECGLHGWCSGSSSRSVCRGSVHSHSWPCLQKQWACEWRPGLVRTQASVDRG